MADRRGVGLLDAYRQYVGDPFASMVGGAARGYLGLEKPTYANEEAYRTAQALGNMPVIGGPAGFVKAAMNAPDALVAMGGLLGKAGAGKLAQSASKLTAPRDKALETAAKNAAKVEQSADPKTRMLQQGYEDGWFHGTTGDIKSFNPSFLGESTGAESAKNAFFFARDPQNPPPSMLQKAPANSESVAMLRRLGIPDEEIARLNTVSMKGHGADTAAGYSSLGGSRTYKEAMRNANAAEKSRKWDDYEKWMKIAEDDAIGSSNELQSLVAKYGDTRDLMLDRINNAVLSKKLPQVEATALDKRLKQLMPYGWYNSYSVPQLRSLKSEIAKIAGDDAAAPALKSIDDFISTKAERQLAEQYQQGSNVMPVALRYKNPLVHDFGGQSYRDQSYADLLKQAKRQGNDAVLMKNTFDPGAGPAKLIDVAAVFNPNQVRSKFAAFDPAKINDPDILGNADPRLLALIAAGTGGGLLGYNYLGNNQGK